MLNQDISDLIFRFFFALIFLALGFEHIFSDSLIQELFPYWIPSPRIVSILCGLWLITFGGLIAIGLWIRQAAIALGIFLLVVTFAVHVPGALVSHPELPDEYQWMWAILQRSNLAKNLCLLGVCVLFLNYKVGKYSWRIK